jgi:hypothetical protein
VSWEIFARNAVRNWVDRELPTIDQIAEVMTWLQVLREGGPRHVSVGTAMVWDERPRLGNIYAAFEIPRSDGVIAELFIRDRRSEIDVHSLSSAFSGGDHVLD